MRVTTDRSESGAAAGMAVPDMEGGTPTQIPTANPTTNVLTLIMRGGSFPSWRSVLSMLPRELADQFNRLFLWTPVFFGLGAAAYLGQTREPTLWDVGILGIAATALALAAYKLRHHRGAVSALAFLAISISGFVVAKIHSDTIAAPIVPPGLGVMRLEGWVVDVETPSDTGERLLIAPVRINSMSPATTPTRVRIVVKSPAGPEGLPPPGSAVHVTALLDPPPGPASPGAYDFARDAWFEGIGGVGQGHRFGLYAGRGIRRTRSHPHR